MSSTLYDLMISLVFMVFLINVSTNPKARIKLNHSILKRLGQVSYGIYMLHPLVIYLLSRSLLQVGIPNDVLLTILAIIITLGLALLSYHYFEKPFLNLCTRKQNHSVIPYLQYH